MKIVTNLTGTSKEGQWNEPHGAVSSVHDEPEPGVIRCVTLGPAGLVVRWADSQVGIPLEELLRLAEQHEPRLRPAPAPEKGNGSVAGESGLAKARRRAVQG